MNFLKTALKTAFLFIRGRKWNKYSLWAVAVGNAARMVYPALDGQMVIDSLADGTFWGGAINVAFTLITARAATKVNS
jgi:hypothetical protein